MFKSYCMHEWVFSFLFWHYVNVDHPINRFVVNCVYITLLVMLLTLMILDHKCPMGNLKWAVIDLGKTFDWQFLFRKIFCKWPSPNEKYLFYIYGNLLFLVWNIISLIMFLKICYFYKTFDLTYIFISIINFYFPTSYICVC